MGMDIDELELVVVISLLCTISLLTTETAATAYSSTALQTYLVQAPAHRKPAIFSCQKDWHNSLLSSAVGNINAQSRLLYSYELTLQGFAARLTAQEAAKLSTIAGVVITFKDRPAAVHTTRTPSFLGLISHGNEAYDRNDQQLLSSASLPEAQQDVVIGLLDTGVWPESASFSDDTILSPIPSRWKGTCETSDSFDGPSLCNRKLIGARAFYQGYEADNGPINQTLEFKSPRDKEGHGTHTSSTAAGSPTSNASLLGLAPGTASGMAPLSRIAIYKVCWFSTCYDSDILAAFEAAISDGVDVVSVSLGSYPIDYFQDMIAVGSFAAMARGIITSCSAGNGGPRRGSVGNVAPWIFTITASSIDRDFPAPVGLGNTQTYEGVSVYVGGNEMSTRTTGQLGLVYARNAVANGGDRETAGYCGSVELLDPEAVKGKTVLCDRGGGITRTAKGSVVKKAGGAAMIIGNDIGSGDELIADSHILPATLVNYESAVAIKQYITSTTNATAHIDFMGTKLGIKPAPIVTAFSSRGPNPVTPEILKPDITAPGLNILAAWTDALGPSSLAEDERRVPFNILSGTSMSCPHIAGVTALLKAAHPTWSPAAIKSALMTTAKTVDNTGKLITESSRSKATTPMAYGAGHVCPDAAIAPGLIYDIAPQDYIDFLCSLNRTNVMAAVGTFAVILGLNSTYDCRNSSITAPGDLNYPSISAVYHQNIKSRSSYKSTLMRTLTNVGPTNCTYTASIKHPHHVIVSIKPSALNFNYVNQKLTYSITLHARKRTLTETEASSFGSLVWSDGYHQVYSPISFTWLAT